MPRELKIRPTKKPSSVTRWVEFDIRANSRITFLGWLVCHFRMEATQGAIELADTGACTVQRAGSVVALSRLTNPTSELLMLAPSASTCQVKLMSAVKHLRERLGWSQQRLADAIGMSLASVRNYEAGAIPSAEALAKLRAIWPADFESIFAKGSEVKRVAANEQWHRILESVLNSDQHDIIDALKSSLMVFNRIVGERSPQLPVPKRSRRDQTGEHRPVPRPRTKKT